MKPHHLKEFIMNEMNARLAIMAVEELTAAQKLIMLYLLTRVDWSSWAGSVSTNDIELGTRQSGRNIKRSLKALAELGYIEREIMRRDDGLHHKSAVKVIISKLGDRKSPPTKNDTSDRKSPPIVTESHHQSPESSDRKSPSVVTEWPKGGDRKSQGVVTNWPKGGDRKSPNINKDQYNINIDQSVINEAELETESAREAEEEARAKMWDQIMSKAEELPPPPPKPTEELKDGFYILSHINDDLDYRREVYQELTHHKRQDIRDALWARGDDQLFNKMMGELIAPRSAIDWVTFISSGHKPNVSTPPAPPPKPTSWTITVDQQQKIKEADDAWLNADYGQAMKNNGGWS
jgi:hypothetical protein